MKATAHLRRRCRSSAPGRTGRFALEATAPDRQLGGDTTDLCVLGVDLKLAGVQDIGDRERCLYDAFVVDVRESSELIAGVVAEAVAGPRGLVVHHRPGHAVPRGGRPAGVRRDRRRACAAARRNAATRSPVGDLVVAPVVQRTLRREIDPEVAIRPPALELRVRKPGFEIDDDAGVPVPHAVAEREIVVVEQLSGVAQSCTAHSLREQDVIERRFGV